MNKTLFRKYVSWLWSQTRGDDDETIEYKYQMLVAMNLLTSTLMWGFTIVAFVFVTPFVGLIGLTCSLLHTLSPISYRLTKSMPLAASLLVGTGYVFQFGFSYFTGGFFSPTMVWLAVHPVIVAVLTNKKHSLVWACISILGLVGMYLLDKNYPAPENLLQPSGRYLTQMMTTVGFVVLNGAFSVFLIEMGYFYHSQIESRNLQIRNLIRTLTHDLSNPLSLVYLKNEMILNGKSKDPIEDSKKMKKALDAIRAILDHARDLDAIETGKISLKIVDMSLKELKENTELIFDERKSEKGIQFDWTQFDQSLRVRVDSIAFTNQVFNNLISNSIKFSFPNAKILFSTEQRQGQVFIRIKDHGMGIHPNILIRLFDAFSSTTTIGTNGEKGTGFGMLLCRSYLEHMSGAISVRSQHVDLHPEDHWTEVTIQIPLA